MAQGSGSRLRSGSRLGEWQHGGTGFGAYHWHGLEGFGAGGGCGHGGAGAPDPRVDEDGDASRSAERRARAEHCGDAGPSGRGGRSTAGIGVNVGGAST